MVNFVKNFYIFLFIALSGACSTSQSSYPPHWWEAPHTSEVKSWEILPNQAKPGEVILSKRNELGLLSNFAATPFRFNGKHYNSLEGFWQMMKFPELPQDPRINSKVKWPYTREQVAQMVGFTAKRAGDLANKNMKKLGISWITFEGKKIAYLGKDQNYHFELIKKATWAKVNQNPPVKDVLLKTGTLNLKPDHVQRDNPPKAWQYFKIYMQIRSNLQNIAPKN